LGSIGDVVCYGPGFSDERTLSLGIQQFVNEQPSFDFVVTDSFVLDWRSIVKRENPFAFAYINFHSDQYPAFAADAESFFSTSEAPKLFWQNMDPYNVSTELIELLERSKTYVVGWGSEFHTPVVDISSPADNWRRDANDNYYIFASKNAHRFISLPFFVAENEIAFSNLQDRPIVVHVPGAGYSERRGARRSLGVDFPLSDFAKRLREYYQAKRPISWTRKDILMTRFNFTTRLEDARVCYVTGSSLNLLVRKYFEVPAKGCVMACTQANGLQDVGFRSGDNCVILPSPEELRKYLNQLDSRWDIAQEIADRGRQLILRKHTLGRRVEQLKSALAAIQAENFSGSRWESGEFRVLVSDKLH